ncbi:MAG: efflux RND transporter periplasmic adaptor subunit [Muribaculaceae bacterium]|nr:efflux RND transporter periplasmic adaptor subunit [Muribaculaceae bacterium]
MDKKIDKSQLRREATRRWIKWGIGAIIAVAIIVVAFSSIKPGVMASDLTIATVDEGPLETTIPASGRVVPAHEEIINSPVNTRVLKVFAQPGDSVKAGTPLLQLDLEQEETALDKLIDSRNMQQQELTQLQLNHQTMISDLEMQIEVNEMNVNRMRIEVDNERRLDSLGSGTGDRVRQAETAYAAGLLELKQLRTKLANERLRTAAAERVQQLNVSSVDKDIELMKRTLHQGQIPAPLDGVLTFIASDLGSQVGAGEKVAVVSDLSRFKIMGDVPEGSSNRVEIGSRVNVRIGREQLAGTVTNITPQAKQGVVSFVVNLDDPRHARLRSGLRTELYVSYGYKDNVLRLPSGAFFKGHGDYQLFVLDGENNLVKRQVKVGDSNRDYVEIISGLKAGDQVVISDMEQYRSKGSLKLKN